MGDAVQSRGGTDTDIRPRLGADGELRSGGDGVGDEGRSKGDAHTDIRSGEGVGDDVRSRGGADMDLRSRLGVDGVVEFETSVD